jgi:hypothetical protein
MKLNTTAAIRAEYARLVPGGHWFDRSTMRFFGSLVGREAWPVESGALFISSELDMHHGDRRFTVRTFDSATGEIGDSVHGFRAFGSRDEARRAAWILSGGVVRGA